MKLPFLLLIGVALFSLGGFLSTFESYEPLKSIAVIARLVFLTVFWFWLGTVVLRRQEHITRAISCWVLSAAICGGGAIVQLLVGDVIPNASIDGGRATGFTAHPNDLGALTAIAFVPALMLASRPRIAAATRAWSYALLLLVAAGLILSGVRGRAYRGGCGDGGLAGVPAHLHSRRCSPSRSRCVRGRPADAAVDPWRARSTRPPAIRDDQLIVARQAEPSSDPWTSASGPTEWR